jgi:hypothetical protein
MLDVFLQVKKPAIHTMTRGVELEAWQQPQIEKKKEKEKVKEEERERETNNKRRASCSKRL